MDDGMKAAEQFERDYEQGRRAGYMQAILQIWDLIDKLQPDEKSLIIDAVIEPLNTTAKAALNS